MRRTIAFVSTVLVVSLALGGCASLQRSVDEGNAARVARLLSEGKGAELAKISASPFLLDGEIIALPGDVAGFWDGVAKAGLRLDPALSRAVPVGAESWREFGQSREVKVWFSKYVAQGVRLFELRTVNGGRVLLLVREGLFSRTVYGFKGPF